MSGEQLWSEMRRSGLYVAAVDSERVVIAENSGLRALSLENGETLWETTLASRLVSGRGVRAGSIYHLPVRLASVDPEVFDRGDNRKPSDTPDGYGT